jgi:parallel beta-helix repeat protein
MPAMPAAFMSYVRFNDQHDDGQLSQFRERLAAEVRAQTGQKFAIFQDRNDIAWGQNWQQRIDEMLGAVTLLLVIITPSLFHSQPCRDEFRKFLDRERVLARSDLILPVYYIRAREMDDPGLRAADEMATVLTTRQFADWRELRFEPFTSPLVRKAIAQLASRIGDTFWQTPAEPGEQPSATGRMTTKAQPPTHVVDAYQRGDFATVSAAIEAAKPGDRILVRPGLYEEGLVVDKPLEILGDGPVSDIEIRARGANALLFRASIGRVANLTLRQAGSEGEWYGVDIIQGRLDLEGCDISSQSLACVAIRNGADPRLRRNQIHDGRGFGVDVRDSGLGMLEDNDITANGRSGVMIRSRGNPTLRRNQIHDNKEYGVDIGDSGQGTLEDNDITANTHSGVVIMWHSNPTLRRNQIHDNKGSGVFVGDSGLGTLEDNDITANGRSGVEVRLGCITTIRGNRINRNSGRAVFIQDDCRGVVEDNDLTGNKQGALYIAKDCEANVSRARNKE